MSKTTKYSRETVQVNCLICGAAWLKRKSYAEAKQQHFCSRRCVIEARRKGLWGAPLLSQSVPCAVCGISVKRKPSDIAKSGSALAFCGREHQSLGIKMRLLKTNPIRSSSFNAGRARARAMFPISSPCEVCGAKNTERHHKDGIPTNNAPENIAWLCRKHHVHADRLHHLRRMSKIGVPISISRAERNPNGTFKQHSKKERECAVFEIEKQ